MLTRLIDLCLTYRPIVLLAAAVLAVFGAAGLLKLPFDAFPDTTPVQVQVNTTAPALSPLEVERQITFPVEQAISGLPGSDHSACLAIFSLRASGLSVCSRPSQCRAGRLAIAKGHRNKR